MINSEPFRDLWDALVFYRTKNPARALSINLLEAERPGFHEARYASSDLWAAVVCAIRAAERTSPALDATIMRLTLTGAWDELQHPVDVAARLHRSERTVYRIKRRCIGRLEAELDRRGLLKQSC